MSKEKVSRESNLLKRSYVASMAVLALTIFAYSALPSIAQEVVRDAEGIRFGLKRQESSVLEIAVPPFRFAGVDKMKRGVDAARIVNFDLKMSGFFKPFKNETFLKNTDDRDIKRRRIDYAEWRALSSNYLLKGLISVTASGDIVIDARVYDLQKRRKTFSSRYHGPASSFRSLIHTISDDVLYSITGERGIARSKIAFVSKVGGRKELFTMDYDGNDIKSITKDRSIVLFPDWHPTLNKILFTTYRYRNPDIYVLDLDSNTRYPLSRRIGLNSTGEWSPDGKKVVFSFSLRGNSEIFVINADGKGMTQLTRSYAIETSPSWSPDQKHIVYTSDRPGYPQIYIMRADGESKRRLTYSGKYNDGAAWSPNGDVIAYTSLFDGRFDIAHVDATDIENRRHRDVRRLTDGSVTREAPSWSPNGQIIAFMGNRAGRKQIFIMNKDGSNMTQITFLRGGGYSPSWGPK